MQFTYEQVNEKKKEICIALGLDPKKPPVNIKPEPTGEVIDRTINTLSMWRTTGRCNLPFVKSGRMVLYPLTHLLEFLLRNEVQHTGEVM